MNIQATGSGDKVLIHCRAGRSRSCTMCVAYGMHKRRLTLDEAYKAVQQRRTRMKVNLGFQMALMKLEKSLFQVETNSLDFFGKRVRKRAARYED